MSRADGPGKRLRRTAAAAILLVAWSVSFAPGPARADFHDLGALFKFKAHKDQPAQVPIGTPIALVAVGAALLFLPSILALTGNTIFDGADVAAPLADALSCPTFEGAGTILGESGCAWAKVTGQRTRQFDTTTDSGGVTLGGQVEFAPLWFLSGTLGAASLGMRDDSVGATGTGQAFSGSVAVKHTAGPWYFAGALAAASRSMHLSRDGGQAFGDVTVLGGALRLRGAYDFAFTDWYLRPRLDLDLIHSSMPGFQETGPGPANLAVSGFSRTGVALTPAVEVGGRYDLDGGTILRPYLALGFTLQPDSGTTVEARFTNGALASLGSFRATTSGPGAVGNLEAGLQWYRVKGLELKAEYRLSAGDAFLSQTASLRGAYRF